MPSGGDTLLLIFSLFVISWLHYLTNEEGIAMEKVVRAVDVGFGNVKYSVRHDRGTEVDCRLFPSLCSQATGVGASGPMRGCRVYA